MLDLADAGHFARKILGKLKMFGFGLDLGLRWAWFQIWLNSEE